MQVKRHWLLSFPDRRTWTRWKSPERMTILYPAAYALQAEKCDVHGLSCAEHDLPRNEHYRYYLRRSCNRLHWPLQSKSDVDAFHLKWNRQRLLRQWMNFLFFSISVAFSCWAKVFRFFCLVLLILLLLFVCFSRFNVAKQENEQAKHDEWNEKQI